MAVPGELLEMPIIAILRGCPAAKAVAMAEVVLDAGIRLVEVTLDSPDALGAIMGIARLDRGLIGAGTVRSAADVTAAVDSGAQFIVSPIASRAVIEEARRLDLPVFPGAATPTEIYQATEWGADGVKVFPAQQLGGPDYLRAVAAPLGHPPLVPTGGISPANARGYLDAGAIAIGAGGSLFSRSALATSDLEAVADRAHEFVRAVT